MICGCSRRESAGAPEAGDAFTPAPSSALETLAPPVANAIETGDTHTLRATWLSNTGNTVINVDAAIEIPDTQIYPIIEVGRRLVSEDEVRGMISAAFPNGTYTGGDGYARTDVKKGEGSLFDHTQYEWNVESTETVDTGITGTPQGPMRPKGSLHAVASEYGGIITSSKAEYFSALSGSYYIHKISPLRDLRDAGNPYSPSEARAIADNVILSTSGDMLIAASGVCPDEYSDESDINAWRYYVFIYTRAPSGIPVTYTTTQTGHKSEAELSEMIMSGSYNTSYYYETALAIISDVGLYYALYESPYEIIGVLEEDCARISLDEAARIAKSMLPLKYTSLERTYDKIDMTINRVTLGYTRVQMKDAPDRFILVPAWDFFGEYTMLTGGAAVNTHAGEYQSLLTLNAIDGTVIDRGYGY